MKTTTRVHGFTERAKPGATFMEQTYRLEVQEWNKALGKWETIWSMVRSDPFDAQIIHDKESEVG